MAIAVSSSGSRSKARSQTESWLSAEHAATTEFSNGDHSREVMGFLHATASHDSMRGSQAAYEQIAEDQWPNDKWHACCLALKLTAHVRGSTGGTPDFGHQQAPLLQKCSSSGPGIRAVTGYDLEGTWQLASLPSSSIDGLSTTCISPNDKALESFLCSADP